MADRLRQWWTSGTSTRYHKIEAHSRNVSLDVPYENAQLHRTVKALQRWLVVLGVLLAAALIALGTNLTLQNGILAKRSPVPRMPMKVMTFKKHDVFAQTSNRNSDHAWETLMPPGDGFVVVKQPERFDLPPGLPSAAGQTYNMAAFHNIHCLTSIRQYLWHLKFAVDQNTTDQVKSILLEPQEDHILECFEYLRQSIMCSADTTLEWPNHDNDKSPTIDGWGVQHQCVDWKALVRFAKDNAPQ